MQGLETNLQVLLVLLVPLRDARVEIPAVVIEARLGGKVLDFGPRFLLDIQKPNNDVGDLDARIVDVVLNVDFPAGKAQQADERVPENRVAQVPDVCGLVGIDAGVLDQNLTRRADRLPVPGRRPARPPSRPGSREH